MAAIVSPSTRTSATYDPDAVTTVPFAMSVRIRILRAIVAGTPGSLARAAGPPGWQVVRIRRAKRARRLHAGVAGTAA